MDELKKGRLLFLFFFCNHMSNSSISLDDKALIFLEGPGMHADDG